MFERLAETKCELHVCLHRIQRQLAIKYLPNKKTGYVMRKFRTIKVLLFLATFYICIQLFKHLFTLTPTEKEERNHEHSQEELLRLVHVVSAMGHQTAIEMFVIEPAVLKSLSMISEDVDCAHLCQVPDSIALGVLAINWKKKGLLLSDLGNHDIVSAMVTSPDPRLLSFNKTLLPSIATHYFLHFKDSIRPFIHLVVFYERAADNFLWHDAVQLTEKLSYLHLDVDELSFGQHAGAFDRFTLIGTRIDGIRLFIPHTVKEFLVQLPQSTFIECDYHQAQTFHRKYSQDLSNEAQQFKRKARQLLSRGKEILDDLGVRFWLSSGTCLGWFRQCDIITYSKDIDFGIWIKDYQEDIISSFEGRGFSLKHVFGKESDSYELSFKASDIKLDLFFFYEDKDNMWNGGTDAWTGQKYKYYFPKFGVCWTVFLGLRVRVPCPTLPYVMANYGKNWNTPVKSWDWKTSPANVKENGVWSKEEWENVIQVYE